MVVMNGNIQGGIPENVTEPGEVIEYDWESRIQSHFERMSEIENGILIFNMPDRSVLHSCDEVDNYHNLCSGLTYLRICKGWTEKDCANNRRRATL